MNGNPYNDLAPGYYYWHILDFSGTSYFNPWSEDWSYVFGFTVAASSPPTTTPPTSQSKLALSTSLKAVQKGKAVTIKGQLKDASGKPIAGKQVQIKANGKVVKTVTTNAGGSFSFKHKPKKNTTYQASFAGDSSFSSSSSKAVKVTVKKAKKKVKKKK